MRYLREKDVPEMADAVEPNNLLYWQAYHHLRGSRPIPFSEIMVYADSYLGLTSPVDRGRLVRVIMSMDNAERSTMEV